MTALRRERLGRMKKIRLGELGCNTIWLGGIWILGDGKLQTRSCNFSAALNSSFFKSPHA